MPVKKILVEFNDSKNNITFYNVVNYSDPEFMRDWFWIRFEDNGIVYINTTNILAIHIIREEALNGSEGEA